MEGQIRDWQDRIACVELVGEKLARFLQKAFTGCDEEACELGGAVAAYLGHGFRQQIDKLKEYQLNPPPSPWGSPVEQLARLCKDRDVIQQQIDEADEMIANSEGMPGGEMMALGAKTLIAPVRRQLESYNEQISALQAQMEKENA
jgi:hypothetical protein